MKKPFCPLPWVMLATRNDGKVRLCAQSHSSPDKGVNRGDDGKIFTINQSTLAELKNSNFMKSVRKEFLQGRFPESCGRCAKEVQAGLRSRPDYESANWQNFIDLEKARQLTRSDGHIESPIRFLDLRLGNLCNLKCRTCNPTESSSWYADHVSVWGKSFKGFQGQKLRLHKEGSIWQVQGDSFCWGENEKIAPALKEALETVELIHFSGGEPLLLKSHYKILEFLKDIGRSGEVRLEYITNLTVLPEKALQLWQDFLDVRIGISIDGVGAVNDYVRYPSRWNQIESHMAILDRWQRPESIWYALTLHAYNIFYLPELIEWRIHSPFLNINNREPDPLFSVHPLHNPSFLNIQMLPSQVKSKVSQRLQSYLAKGSRDGRFDQTPYPYITTAAVEALVSGYIDFMNQQDQSSFFTKFIDYTDSLDKVRKQSMAEALPEFSQCLRQGSSFLDSRL
ncbi:MAG: radical SAM protein [Bdellovibrionales bacterium]|nr:radical SAM protein [Bdellovibrionales bacterium]